MSDLTPQEIDVIKACLEGESETLEGCRHSSLPSSAVNDSKKVIAAIIEKLNGGTGTAWMVTEEKIKGLLVGHTESVLKTSERLYKSGAMDFSNYNHNEFAIAKVMLTASLIENCDNYAPLGCSMGASQQKEDLDNLSNF